MEAQQNRPRLRSCVLLSRRCFPWTRLLNQGDDRDFVFVMGLDRAAFKILLQPFTRMYHKYTLKGNRITSKQASNCNRALDAAGVLALVLHWLPSKVEEKYLCFIFCVTVASVSEYKNFGLRILLDILTKRKDCRVSWPSEEEQATLAAMGWFASTTKRTV